MMRFLILLGVLAIARSAPLDEAARVKRAQEFVMFSNQDNEASDKVKRSEDVPDEQIDQNGLIVSHEPTEIESEDMSTESEEVPIDSEGVDVGNTLAADDSTGDGTEILAPEEEAETSEEASEPYVEDDSAEVENNEDLNGKSDMDFEKYYESLLPEYYYNLMANQKSTPGYYDLYQQYPFVRKRRSRERIFNGDKTSRFRMLKRNRRIKRDLLYPSDSLRDYPYADDYQRSSDGYNEVVDYLLDLLDEKYNEQPAYNTPYAYNDLDLDPYEQVEEPVEELVYPGYEEPEIDDVMSKRQAGLTFVPGFKRTLYPAAFREPYSHFQAFVSKRRSAEDYAEALRRVMGLASALRDNEYYPANYGYQDFEYRKK